MRARISEIPRLPVLPHGAADAARQLSLFAAAYGAYSLIRGIVAGSGARPFTDATRIIDLERSLHVFVEPALQAWAESHHPLITAAVLVYLNAHLTVSAGALVYIYLRRNASFYFVRNMAMVAMALALLGYLLYPTAPPRLMPAWGFSDPVAALVAHGTAGTLVNVYAAVPSMHVCFAVMVGGSMARLVEHAWAKALWLLYPLLIASVVLITGNHFLTDIVLGALTAALGALIAQALLARARPDVWTFGHPTPYCADRSHA